MTSNVQKTAGTWIMIACNCIIAVVGVLQGVDWVNLAGNQTAGWVAAVLAALNVIAHYYTGPAPVTQQPPSVVQVKTPPIT